MSVVGRGGYFVKGGVSPFKGKKKAGGSVSERRAPRDQRNFTGPPKARANKAYGPRRSHGRGKFRGLGLGQFRNEMHARGVRVGAPQLRMMAMGMRHYGIQRKTGTYDRIAAIATMMQRKGFNKAGQPMRPTLTRKVATAMSTLLANKKATRAKFSNNFLYTVQKKITLSANRGGAYRFVKSQDLGQLAQTPIKAFPGNIADRFNKTRAYPGRSSAAFVSYGKGPRPGSQNPKASGPRPGRFQAGGGRVGRGGSPAIVGGSSPAVQSPAIFGEFIPSAGLGSRSMERIVAEGQGMEMERGKNKRQREELLG